MHLTVKSLPYFPADSAVRSLWMPPGNVTLLSFICGLESQCRQALSFINHYSIAMIGISYKLTRPS